MNILSSIKARVDLATANSFQRRVLHALTNDSTPTPTSTLTSIALSTYDWSHYQQTLDILFPLLSPPPSQTFPPFHVIHKSLLLLHSLLRHGNPDLPSDLRLILPSLTRLAHFTVMEDGKEVGGGVRQLASTCHHLVLNVDEWREMREEARRSRERLEGKSEQSMERSAVGGQTSEVVRKDSGWLYERQELEHFDVVAMRQQEDDKRQRRQSTPSSFPSHSSCPPSLTQSQTSTAMSVNSRPRSSSDHTSQSHSRGQAGGRVEAGRKGSDDLSWLLTEGRVLGSEEVGRKVEQPASLASAAPTVKSHRM